MHEDTGPEADTGRPQRRPLRTLATLAVVIIVMLGGIRLLDAIGSSKPDDGGDSGTPVPDQHLPLQPGAAAAVVAGDDGSERSTVTLGEVIDGFTHPSNQFVVPAAGHRWWGIEVGVENTGATSTDSLRFRLRLDGGATYDPRFIVGVPGMIEYTYSDLPPGASMEGWIFFEIPAAARVEALRVAGRDGPRGQEPPAVLFEAP